MVASCPECHAPLAELLHGDVDKEVQEHVLELHNAGAIKIDHVRRGDEQRCWCCNNPTKGFHLYKSSAEFYKLCDSCAQHVATLLAHLVRDARSQPGDVGAGDGGG